MSQVQQQNQGRDVSANIEMVLDSLYHAYQGVETLKKADRPAVRVALDMACTTIKNSTGHPFVIKQQFRALTDVLGTMLTREDAKHEAVLSPLRDAWTAYLGI